MGYSVTGVTLRLHHYKDRPGLCGSSKDMEDARQVAQKLGIPQYVLSATEERMLHRQVTALKIDSYFEGLLGKEAI